MTDLVKIALIAATPPSIIGIGNFLIGWHSRARIGTIEKNTNDMLSKLKIERDEATTRADLSQGHTEGVKAEQSRMTKGI